MENPKKQAPPSPASARQSESRLRQLEEENLKLRAEISEINRAHSELQRKNQNLENIFKANPGFAAYQLVVEPDVTQRRARAVSYVSPNFKQLTGVADPWDDNSWFASMHPDDISKAVEGHQKAADTGLFNEVVRLYHGGKEQWRWLNFISADTGEAEGTVKIFNGLIVDVTDLKRTELRMLNYQKRLQDLSQKQFAGEERERRRVAEVLHDEVGQELALALFKMNQARERQAGLGSLVDELAPLLEQAIAYTRSLTKELCPPALCQMGLADGLDWLAQRNQEQYGIATRLELDADLSGLDEDLGAVLFRIVAELLNNVAKHSEAAHAWVKLKEGDGVIRIEVGDDGVGFDYTPEALQANDGFGLFMISERLRGLGGNLVNKNHPGKGSVLCVVIPCNS